MKKSLSIFATIIALMVLIINSCENNTYLEDEGFIPITEDVLDPNCIEQVNKIGPAKNITRSWQDYQSGLYCANYKTTDDNYQISNKFRNGYNDNITKDYYPYWGKLYKSLYEHDKDKLQPLIDSLTLIREINELDRDQFANVIVSFIQDIPYSYVLQAQKCADREDKSSPCHGNERHGLLSPYEFLHTLIGDCDTRTVLLYTIFKHFDYTPKIVVSIAYEHSMLLLDVATSGEHFYEYGKKYYFWETTATDWEAGIIPPGMGDLYYWNIVLE